MDLMYSFTANEVNNKMYFCLREFFILWREFQRFIISSVIQINVILTLTFAIFIQTQYTKQNKLKSLKVAKWKIKEDGHFADRQMDIGDYYLVFYSTSTNNHICPKIREPFQKRSILRGNVPTVNECSSMWNSFVFEKSRNNFLFFLKFFFPP